MCSIDWPASIQAFAAIATLILAVVLYFQQRKIKTLTDVVGEMKAQTKVLNDSYFLQQRLSTYQQIPHFSGLAFKQVVHQHEAQDAFLLHLVNKGVPATKVTVTNLSDNFISVTYKSKQYVKSNDEFIVTVKPVSPNMKANEYDFKLILHLCDDNGNEFNQLIAVKNETIRVLAPKLVVGREESFDKDSIDWAEIL